ncbi:MAG: MBL fold metallo-hydrolase [Deltaproteobacteria bacterium]|nr:MBL fold metallo-hydrolase [Deltaproteobacteria bacterium]
MSVEIEYLGWVTFRFITENGTRIVMDPFLEGDESRGVSPCVAAVKDLSDTHVVMVTHAAQDHSAQALELMKMSDAVLFSPPDVGIKIIRAGIPSERVFRMIPGVQFRIRDINIKALEASHISMSEFEGHWLTGVPLSFIVDFEPDGKIFFSGDNALGMHYRFFGEFYQPDLAILGIGGVDVHGQSLTELYPHEAAVAASWLNVKAVIPMHFRGNEPQELKQELTRRAPGVELAVMKPGERLHFARSQGLMR